MYAAMTEDKPEGLQISTISQVISCKRVPEQMRVKPFYSGLLLQALTYKFNEVVGTSAPGLIDEERLGTASGITETKPIIKQLRTCLFSHGNQTLFAAFSANHH